MSEDIQSAAPAEAVTQPQEANVEQPPETTPEQSQQEEEQKPKTPDWQRSINRLTRQKYQLQARLEEMERRLAEPPKEQPKPQPGAPKIEDYQDFDAYIAAKAEWVADHKIKSVLAEQQQERQKHQAQEYEAHLAQNWSKRLEAAAKEIPDLIDVLESAVDIPMPPDMRMAIVDSDVGPLVAHYLAQNPEEASRIAGLSGVAVARAIGRIEAKLETSKAQPPKSSAPTPVQPVKGGGSSSVGPSDKDDIATWIKKRNKEVGGK